MAIIFAEDFQQWNSGSGLLANTTTPFYSEITGWHLYQPKYQALGFYPPVGMVGTNGGSWSKPSVYYATDHGGLGINHNKNGTITPYNYPGALGLRRTIQPKGDTLYFSACIEVVGATVYDDGSFLQFGAEASPLSAFTTSNAMPGNFLYTLGVNADNFFTFNGVATTVQAFYRPSSVKWFIDIVFGPGYMEFWFNNELVVRQNRVTVPVTEISIAPTDDAYAMMILRSLMICDNSGGFGERMGRKMVQTFPVLSTGTIESTVPGGYTATQVVGKLATTPTTENDGDMFGSLTSAKAYVKNEFNATRSSSVRKPFVAFVNLQAKRLLPAGDGLSLLPFVTIAGTKVYGNLAQTTSTWKLFSLEVPITAGQTFTAVTFGYEHEYKDLNNVWVDDRSNIEVWGNPAPATQTSGGFLGTSVTVATPVSMQTASYGAYVFDYAKSNLTLTKTDVTNLSYQQNQ